MKGLGTYIFAFLGVAALVTLFWMQTQTDMEIVNRDVLLFLGFYILSCFAGKDNLKDITLYIVDKIEGFSFSFGSKKDE